MPDDWSREDPPTGESLGRHATLYHAGFGALDRVAGAQRLDGAEFYAPEIVGDDHSRVILEYPSDDALAEAWEAVLFESPAHADEVLGDD